MRNASCHSRQTLRIVIQKINTEKTARERPANSLSLRTNCQNQQSEHSARKHNESKQPKKGHVMHQHTNKCTTRYSNFTTCTTKTRKHCYHAINPPQSTGNALGVIHKHTHIRIESSRVPSSKFRRKDEIQNSQLPSGHDGRCFHHFPRG